MQEDLVSLYRQLRSQDIDERYTATVTIGLLGPEAFDAVTELQSVYETSPTDVRCVIIDALAQVDDGMSANWLRDKLGIAQDKQLIKALRAAILRLTHSPPTPSVTSAGHQMEGAVHDGPLVGDEGMSSTVSDEANAEFQEETIAPGILKSNNAFQKDLDDLMKTHYRKWVAYHGTQRLGFSRTETRLYEKCLRKGLKEDEFVVRMVAPLLSEYDITFGNDW